jgi:hypothetical protein
VKTRSTPPLTAAQREALEARFALRVSARLEEGAQAVSHDIAERLRVAREQALRTAREARASAALAPSTAPAAAPATIAVGLGTGVGTIGLSVGGNAGAGMPGRTDLAGGWQSSSQTRASGHGSRLEDSPTSWGWRMAAVLPAVALVAGLWGIQHYARQEQVEAATDVDMQLLTDDLPPDAYADPGFEEFLSRDVGPAVRDIEDVPPDIDGDLSTTETQADLGESDAPPASETK